MAPGPDMDQLAEHLGLSEAERRQVEEMAESMQDYARNTDEVVAHHAFQAADGIWHLWAGIRRTAAGSERAIRCSPSGAAGLVRTIVSNP